MSNIKYVPQSGKSAGARNKKQIEEYLKAHPKATGAEIAEKLGLSRVTVYKHLQEYK
jgi:predicted ArsR family transcriptional regulator